MQSAAAGAAQGPKKTFKRDELRKIEQWAQETWAAEKTFEANAPAPGAPAPEKFMITFPFPYMNGKLHLGHSFSLSKAEFAAGFERLQGKRVLFPFAFHCTGMPIKACADKLAREVERFGTEFERYTPEEEAQQRTAAAEAAAETEQARTVDPTKIVKKHAKAASKATGQTFQFQILETLGVPRKEIHRFADARHWLYYFPPIAREDLKAFGLKVDWRRSFITTDVNAYFDSFVRWQFNRLKKANRIKFGERYTIFSPLDNQPCMDHDRAAGEGVGVQEYTGIKLQVALDALTADDRAFVLKHGRPVGAALLAPEAQAALAGRKLFLVAGTLRPETMYGQTNCYVGPELEYGVWAVGDGEAWVATERAARNMAWQSLFPGQSRGELRRLLAVKGLDLVGLPLRAPLATHEIVYCLPMDSVLPGKGTGVVTSVPSDSPDDFVTLRDLQKKPEYYGVRPEWMAAVLPPTPIIGTPSYGNLAAVRIVEELKIASPKDKAQLQTAKEAVYREGFHQGTMLVGKHAGKPVADAKALIRADLVASNDAFTYCEPEGPVVSRSGDDCVVTLCDQWYLEYSAEDWKARARQALAQLETYSPETRAAFERTIEWLREWACSRSYGLGTRLPWDPQWLIESLSDSTVYMAYYTVAHLLQGDAAHPVDGVLDGSNGGVAGIAASEMTDAAWEHILAGGPAPAALTEKLAPLRREFEYFYGFDLRVSGKDLVPNHLTFSLFNHAELFPESQWPRAMRSNGHLLLNGEKMSKSTGNFMTLAEATAEYGADATRFALADAGDGLEDANFVADIANAAILRLHSQLEFVREALAGPLRTSETLLWHDRVFEAEMHAAVAAAERAYRGMLYREALKAAFYDLQSIRDRYRDAVAGPGMHAGLVRRWIELQTLAIAPVCTHWSEHVWRELLGNSGSVLDAGWPRVPEPDAALLQAAEYVRSLAHDIRSREEQQARKAKKRGATPPPVASTAATRRCGRLVVATVFPEWQEACLAVLRECWDGKAFNGNEIRLCKERGLIKDKRVMPFVQGQKRAVEAAGAAALERTLVFDELATLRENVEHLQRALDLAELDIVLAEEAQHPEDVSRAETATPGNPGYRMWLA